MDLIFPFYAQSERIYTWPTFSECAKELSATLFTWILNQMLTEIILPHYSLIKTTHTIINA
jgi:hypothetical protein